MIDSEFFELLFDIIGVGTGIFAIYILISIRRMLGGRINGALWYFAAGIAFMTLAFAGTIVFERLNLLASPIFDGHHLLMTIGMICFIIAVSKLSSLLLAGTRDSL
jgi:hypothetical protein